MKINLVTLLLILVFIYPIMKGFLMKFSSYSVKRDIDGLTGNISFLIGLFAGIYYSKKIFVQHELGIYKSIYDMIPQGAKQYIKTSPIILYIVIMPLTIFIIYKIISILLNFVISIVLYPAIDGIDSALRRGSNIFRRIMGALVQLPRAICYILIVTFLLNVVSIIDKSPNLSQNLGNSGIYNRLCREVVIPITNSKIAKRLPGIIDNSFKIQIKDANSKVQPNGEVQNNAAVVYYNGVTLDEGVRSNSEIDNLARRLCSRYSNKNEQAKILYNWVGQNINYDEEKAQKVMDNDFTSSSGAIPAFNTRKGICFDYACLYVAMCRANGIKVRLITGQGFNGVSWVSHAWNQVYIPERGAWINVDTTFSKGGNYFDSVRFNLDHKGDRIAGEW